MLVVGLLSMAGLAGGCEASFHIGSNEIDANKAEKAISGALTDNYGTAPKSLTCPSGIEAKEGGTFTCTGESPDDPPRPFEIEVTMTSNDGDIRYPSAVTFTDQGAASRSNSATNAGSSPG